MNPLSTAIERLAVNRVLTLKFLDHLALLAAAEARERRTAPREEADRLLAADPSGGAAGSLGWNLMHVAVYEEACCSPLPPKLWQRFGHGAEPGVFVAPLVEIADRLAAARTALLERVSRWREADLERPPQGTTQPAMSRREILDAVVWHEPHHLNVCYDLLRRELTEGESAAGSSPRPASQARASSASASNQARAEPRRKV